MDGSIRVRAAVADHFMSIVIVVAVLALLGGFLTYGAYAQPSTETETVQTATWETTGEFGHWATVVNDTPVYERGDTIRNRSTYFSDLTPRLNGSFEYSYTSSEGQLGANASVWLVQRSVSESSDETTEEYWRTETRLGSERVAELKPGDRLRVPFSTNVTAAALRAEAIDQQVGPTPGQTEIVVQGRVNASGTRNGQPVDRTRTYNMTVTRDGGVYRVAGGGPSVDSGQQREERTVTVAPGPIRAYGGPLLLLLSLGVGVGVPVARRRGALTVTEREREWLAYRNARAEFDEWITAARVSDPCHDDTIDVESLEGLVDIAIDTDNRVLVDEEESVYLLFTADRCYVYRPPSQPTGNRGLFANLALGTSDNGEPPEDASDDQETGEPTAISDGGK